MSGPEATETVEHDATATDDGRRSVEDRLLDVHASDSHAYEGTVADVVEVVDEVDTDGAVTVRFRLPSGHEDTERLEWPASPEEDAKLNRLIDNDRLPFAEQAFSTEALYGATVPVRQVDDHGDDWELRLPDDSLTGRVDALPDADPSLPDVSLPDLSDVADRDRYAMLGGTALGIAFVGLAAGVATNTLTVPTLALLLGLLYVGSGRLAGYLPDVELAFMFNLAVGITGLCVQWLLAAAMAATDVEFVAIAALVTVVWFGAGVIHQRIAAASQRRRR